MSAEITIKCFPLLSTVLFRMESIPTVNMESNFAFLTPDSGSLMALSASALLAGFFCMSTIMVLPYHFVYSCCYTPTTWTSLCWCFVGSQISLYNRATEATVCHFCTSSNLMYLPRIIARCIQSKCKQTKPPFFPSERNPLSMKIFIKSIYSSHEPVVH